MATYDLRIDWNGDGDFTDTGENVTARRSPDWRVAYGRDQTRALSPLAPGEASFELDNRSRDYSPENGSSPLAGVLGPGRKARIQATHSSITYDLFRGYLDEFDLDAEHSKARFGCVDALATVREAPISTPMFAGLRTGDALHLILDAIGWPTADRDIDPGVTFIRYWWGEGKAGDEIDKLVYSEGPPALVTIGGDGKFMFRDRHHRLLRAASTTSQATFRAGTAADPRFSPPLGYDHGWRDVVNSVTVTVGERIPSTDLDVVWETTETIQLSDGQTVEIIARSSDPFLAAVVPEPDVDYTLLSGAVTFSLSRTAGMATTIRMIATGGPAVIQGLRLRGYPVPVVNTRTVHAEDSTSIQKYGLRDYGRDMPWANRYDAEAIAGLIVSQRAERLPIVTLKVVGYSDTNLTQQLARDLSDRVHVIDSLVGLDDDFYIERIEHTIRGASQLHETVFGLEKTPPVVTPVFRFDTAGAGFNDGKFGDGQDDPATMFIFDAGAGHRFDEGAFST